MNLILLLGCLLILLDGVMGAKILFYSAMCSTSIKMTFFPLAQELAKKGHQVTVVWPYAEKEKQANLEIITIQSDFDDFAKNLSTLLLKENPRAAMPAVQLVSAYAGASDYALSHPRLRQIIDQKETFDITVVTPFLANEAGYYLAHRFQSKLVQFVTVQASFSYQDFGIGQPHNPAYIPAPFFHFTHPMTFPQRMLNFLGTWAFHYFGRNYYILNKINAILDKHFPGQDRPCLIELEKNTSLVLHIGHPLINDGLRPVAPNFQYVGMMNCRKPQPLPKDLQAFMDSAKDGVVYVSFGSVLTAAEMLEERRLLLLNVFKRFPSRKFLWKWETEDMPEKPDNVKLSKWLPQQDILAHPKTIMFLSHGGQSSSQEAWCHQKPTVVVSVFGDQSANGREAERVGNGIWIPWKDLTEDNLFEALDKVIHDPKYTQKAKEHGSLLTDQLVPPLEKAVWWIEFLLRHPDKNYFRSPVHDLTWYQYFSLDVILGYIILVLVILWLIKKLICFLIGKCLKALKLKTD